MPTLREYTRIARNLPAGDMRQEKYKAAVLAELDAGKSLDDQASPATVSAIRNAEAAFLAEKGKPQTAMGALPIATGRGFRIMQQGAQQIGEAGEYGKMLREAGIPAQLVGDPRALESIEAGAPYIYPVDTDTTARGAFPGQERVPQGRPREATFTPTPEQSAVVKRVRTLRDRVQEARSEERRIYEQGVSSRFPITSAVGEGVGATAAFPVPGFGPSRTAAKVGVEAADAAARGAGFVTGAREAARQAPVAGLAGAIEYREPEESRLENALFNAAAAGVLSVGSEVGRGLLYKVSNKQRLTPEERELLTGEIAKANPPEAVARTTQIDPEMAAALESVGVEAGGDFGRAVEAIRGALSPQRKEELLATLTPDEVKALTPAQAERLAVFRSFGYEPTPAQVMRDYRGMEDLAAAEQMQMDVSGDAVRQQMARARQAPIEALQRTREEMAGGLEPEALGPTVRGAVTGTGQAQRAAVGQAYETAATRAMESGTRVVLSATLGAFSDIADQFNLGQAGQAAVMMGKWATLIGDSIPVERRREIAKGIREELGSDAIGNQAFNARLFQEYAKEVGDIDPVTLERMRKEVNAMGVSGSGDMAVKERLKQALDQDAAQLPEQFYAEARAKAAERFRFVEQVPEFGKLFDDPNAISDEEMYNKLWKMPLRNWNIANDWIERQGTPETKRLWEASKRMMAAKFYDDLTRQTSVSVRSIGMDGGEDFQQLSAAKFGNFLDGLAKQNKVRKLEAVIGKKGVEELGLVRRYLEALEPPKTGRSVVNPSGSGYKALEGLRAIADRWATSGNEAKIGIANVINNTMNKLEAPFKESPQAATMRTAREELGKDVATEAARRMEALRAREAAERAGASRGFGATEEEIGRFLPQVFSRDEEQRQ